MSSVVCSIVIPMYNEEEVIEETYRRLKKVMDQSGESYELLFINDGSRIVLQRSLPDWLNPMRLSGLWIFPETSAIRLLLRPAWIMPRVRRL